MLTKFSISCLLIFLSLFISKARSQSITPVTVNIGGGSFSNSDYLINWSIGEGAAIETFQIANSSITSGVLQPLTEKGDPTNNKTFPWLKEEIAIFPVPTRNVLEVNIKIIETGQVNIQLLDQRGLMVQSRSFDYIGTNGIQKFNLTNLTAGIYYLNVTLTRMPSSAVIRKSAFKIQKI